jgi:predicted Zn finger-like uncharacterized protein
MPISTSCPHCDTHYNLPDAVAGKKVRCKKCQETFPVSGANGSNGHSHGDTVPVICPHCETPAKSRAVPGTRVRCKRCGEAFTVSGKVRGPARKTALASGDAEETAIQAKVRKSAAHDDDETNGNVAAKSRNGKADDHDDEDDDDAGPRNRLKDSLSSPNKNRKTQRAERDDEDDDDDVEEKTEAKVNKKTLKADRDDEDDDKDEKEEKAKKSDDADGEKKKKKKKKKKQKGIIDMLLSEKNRMKLITGGGGGIIAIIAAIFLFLFGGEPSDEKPKPTKPPIAKKKQPVDESENKALVGTNWSNNPFKTKDGKDVPPGAVKMEFDSDGSTYTLHAGPKELKGKYTLEPKDVVSIKFDGECQEGIKGGSVKISLKESRMTWVESDNGQDSVFTFQIWNKPKPVVFKELDENDPYRIYYEKLKLDPDRFQSEVKTAAEWFLKNFDPKHNWRRKIAWALEVVIDDKNLKTVDACWASFTTWVTEHEVDRLRLQLSRAPKSEHKQMIMHALATFETKDALEVLASCIDLQGTEQQLAQALLAGVLNMDLARDAVKEFVYHHDPDVRNIAYSLREIYGEEPKSIPRLPPLKPDERVTYDSVPAELESAKELAGKGKDEQLGFLKYNWTNPARMKQLAVLGWLQTNNINLGQWAAISKALDPLLMSHDQFMRTETQTTLLKWVTAENISSLVKFYGENEFKYEKSNAIELLKRIPNPGAKVAIIGLLEGMIPLEREPLCKDSELGADDSFLMSLQEPAPRMALLGLFNSGASDIRLVARRAMKKYLLERELLFAQCFGDLGDEVKGNFAMQWLNSQEPLIARGGDMKIIEYGKTLEGLAMPTDDPKKQALQKAAQSTISKWGEAQKDIYKYWIKVLTNKEYHENDWKNCRFWAINNLTDAGRFEAIPAMVFRYKDVQDAEQIRKHLQRFTDKDWDLFDKKLCEAFQTPSKAKKLEVIVIMDLEGGAGCLDALKATFEAHKNIAEDRDLCDAITAAERKIKVRVKENPKEKSK